jgi:hypothetical protein
VCNGDGTEPCPKSNYFFLKIVKINLRTRSKVSLSNNNICDKKFRSWYMNDFA